MSKRRKPHPTPQPKRTIPGGCPDCNAYTTIDTNGGLIAVLIHHDAHCPYYRGVTA